MIDVEVVQTVNEFMHIHFLHGLEVLSLTKEVRIALQALMWMCTLIGVSVLVALYYCMVKLQSISVGS
jgi:hypothetical protein